MLFRSGSANLEFWETFDVNEVAQYLFAANQAIAEQNNVTNPTEELQEEVLLTPEDSLKAELAKEALADAEVEKAYPLLSKLQVMQGTGPVIGYARKADMNAIDEMLESKVVKEKMPRNLIFRWDVKPMSEKEQVYRLYALKQSGRNGRPALEGDVITDAREDFQQHHNAFEISMAMNAEGAKVWARLTKENIGKAIAIVLDDAVYSAPRVNDEITGGRSSITGDFTAEEARDLANVLKSGKMAAKVSIIQSTVIGPSLGQEAVRNGVTSFAVALLLLFIYMFCVYGVIPGLVANCALIINLFFTMGILSSFHAVLTLSGIAGLVLSLGVAVDANEIGRAHV